MKNEYINTECGQNAECAMLSQVVDIPPPCRFILHCLPRHPVSARSLSVVATSADSVIFLAVFCTPILSLTD